MLRRTLLTGLAALPALPCRAGATAPRSLTFSWPTNAGPLHPHLYAPNQIYAQAMLYEPLVRYREGGRIEPALATAWQVEEDGRGYVFELRRGVRFHDGAPFDAAAAVRNIEAVLRNRPRHAWLEVATQIEGAEALGRDRLRLRLRGPYYPTLLELALTRPFRFASPAALREDGGLEAPVGTGPWRLGETRRGVHDLFLRNEDHWAGIPALERVLVKVVPDSNTRALALETGEIDLAYGADQLDADTFRRFAADPRFRTAISPPLATRLLAVNASRFPTDDLAVRQAIARAVDRAALVRHVLLDTEPPAEALFAENLPHARLGLRAAPLDRAAAAALLERAGWILPPDGRTRRREGRDLTLELCFTGTDALQKALAEAVQADLARIGIAARLVGEDAGTFLGRQRSGAFGMIFADTWGAPYDPHAFLSSMRQPVHADYHAQRGLPAKNEIDRRIGAVLATTAEEERAEEHRWLLETLHAEAIYFPISFLTNKLVQRAGTPPIGFGDTRYEIPFGRAGHGG